MIRQEKGVTLTALIITIIVMIILASITIIASNNLSEKAKLKSLQTSMLLVQAKIEEIYNKYEYGNTVDFPTETVNGEQKAVLPGEDVEDSDIKEVLYSSDSLNAEQKAEEDNFIKHLTSGMNVGTLSLEVDNDDLYVNYKTGEVYSSTGFNSKHLLSELKNY